MSALPVSMGEPHDDPPDAAKRRLRVVEPERPRTRGDCVDGPRPCPWASCRYHLAVDVTATGARVLHEDIDAMDPDESCALDIADRCGGIRQEDTAEILDLSIESIRQIEIAARAGMRLAGGPLLRQIYDEGGEHSARVEVGEIGEQSAPMFWGEEPDNAAALEAEAGQWSGRVVSLLSAGLRMTAACDGANRGTYADGTELDSVEETAMARTEPELRKAILEALDTAPTGAKVLGESLEEPRERIEAILKVLRDEGKAHVVKAGPATKWHAGAGASEAKAPKKPKAKSPVSVSAADPVLDAGIGLKGAPRDVLERLVGMPVEQLMAIDRIMTRLAP